MQRRRAIAWAGSIALTACAGAVTFSSVVGGFGLGPPAPPQTQPARPGPAPDGGGPAAAPRGPAVPGLPAGPAARPALVPALLAPEVPWPATAEQRRFPPDVPVVGAGGSGPSGPGGLPAGAPCDPPLSAPAGPGGDGSRPVENMPRAPADVTRPDEAAPHPLTGAAPTGEPPGTSTALRTAGEASEPPRQPVPAARPRRDSPTTPPAPQAAIQAVRAAERASDATPARASRPRPAGSSARASSSTPARAAAAGAGRTAVQDAAGAQGRARG